MWFLLCWLIEQLVPLRREIVFLGSLVPLPLQRVLFSSSSLRAVPERRREVVRVLGGRPLRVRLGQLVGTKQNVITLSDNLSQ